MDSGIEWVEELPEPFNRRQGATEEIKAIIAELKTRPGQWARVAKKVGHSTRARPFKNAGCETALRSLQSKTEKGRPEYDLFARWPMEEVTTTVRNDVDGLLSKTTEQRPKTMREQAKDRAVDPESGFVEADGEPVREKVRHERERSRVGSVPPPEGLTPGQIRTAVLEAAHAARNAAGETPTEELNRKRAAVEGPTKVVSEVTEEELQRRSAELAAKIEAGEVEQQRKDPILSERPAQAGQPAKAKLAPGKPRRMQGETEQSYNFRLARWSRGVPPEGKKSVRR